MNLRVLSLITLLGLAAAPSLSAQRRTTDGNGGGSDRGTPSGSSGRGSDDGRRSGSGTPSRASGRDGFASSGSRNHGRSSGKIGAIAKAAARDEARARRRVIIDGGIYLGECFDCSYWGYYGPRWGWYHGGWWYPARNTRAGDAAGQGYDDYPYASSDTASSFVQQHTDRRRSYGVVTGQYFADAGSTTRAGRFGIEGAFGQVRGELEYAYYAEPLTGGGKDEMQTTRFALGVQPRLGHHAFLYVAVGGRALAVNGGHTAGGPEGELGVQLLPRKPFGVNVTGRLADLTWNGQDYFVMKELNTTGSVFVNRVELQAGWHWLKVAGSPAFGGPVVGLRVWF